MNSSVGGLIVAGSYVPKTTSQLEILQQKSGTKLKTITIQVEDLLKSPQNAANLIQHASETAAKEIENGQDVLVMTSRELVKGSDGAESLNIGSTVAKSLVDFLSGLRSRPRYVIAKVRIWSAHSLILLTSR